MLYRIGNEQEYAVLEDKLPKRVLSEILRGIVILTSEYGTDGEGGYTLVAETTEDIAKLKEIIDYYTHPCEWATRIGRDTRYLSALYLLNNDFAIMVYMPVNIAPTAILTDLED